MEAVTIILEYLSPLRTMYTASAINYSVISFLFGGMICARMKKRHWFLKCFLLAVMIQFMKHEISFSTRTRDNYLKLLGIPYEASSSEFNAAIRQRKGVFHPDNSVTGDNDKFILVGELGEALQHGYRKKMELYYTYGDSFDILSSQPPSDEDSSTLLVNRGIETIANYLMLILITFLFFQNSANRGYFQKGLIILMFLTFFCIDVILDYKFDLEDKRGSSMKFADWLVDWYQIPFATVPDLLNCLRLILVSGIAFFYFYGILFQFKEEEILLANTERYYLKLHRINKAIDKEGEAYKIDTDLDESWRILNSLGPSVEYIKKYSGKAEGLSKFLSSLFSYIYYGIIGALILFNLYSKYSRQIHDWLNQRPSGF